MVIIKMYICLVIMWRFKWRYYQSAVTTQRYLLLSTCITQQPFSSNHIYFWPHYIDSSSSSSFINIPTKLIICTPHFSLTASYFSISSCIFSFFLIFSWIYMTLVEKNIQMDPHPWCQIPVTVIN